MEKIKVEKIINKIKSKMIDKNTTLEEIIEMLIKSIEMERKWVKEDEEKAMWKRKGIELVGRTIQNYYGRWKEINKK